MDTAELIDRISVFLEFNPWSTAQEFGGSPILERPWGDETLRLLLNRIDDVQVDGLNDLILPPAFSGIYHRSSRSLELIYTPFRQTDTDGRSFSFSLEGKTYECGFSEPSEHVNILAISSDPIQPPTKTDYRNLRHFRRYLALRQDHGEEEQFQKIYKPLSFWIHDCDYNEDELIRLAEHVNFYMVYFDRLSPVILVHDTDSDTSPEERRVRFLWDDFPSSIRATPIQPYLLGQWNSARLAGDSFRKFIYYYQMLEFAAFYFLTERSEKQIEAILRAPETGAFPNRGWQRIQDILAGERIEEAAKLVAVVKQSVDVPAVWKEIDANRSRFEQEIHFDGGFIVSPIISPSTDLEAFRASGLEKLVNTFRTIRNALVHAREKRMSDVISPTSHNHMLVRPFLRPLCTIAMHVARCDNGPCA